MSECRAVTILIGNGVATVAISRWEGEVTKETLRKGCEVPDSLSLCEEMDETEWRLFGEQFLKRKMREAKQPR